jgi:polygalacturonase
LFLDDHKFIIDENDRPHLIHMENCQFIKIHDIIMKNSPQFHLKMDHCHDAELYNLNIRVNTTAQLNLMKKLSL